MWDQTQATAAAGSNYGLVANNSYTFPTSSAGGGGSHTHGITLSSDNTTSTGSGTAINSLPPYYTVYIWTRTV